MNCEFSDIKIVNKGQIYNLNKIMLMRIPFFRIMFVGKFEEKDKNVIEIDVNEKYWMRVLRDIYKYQNIEIFEDFDPHYIDFLKYLGLDKDIEIFHNYLQNILDNSPSSDYPCKYEF